MLEPPSFIHYDTQWLEVLCLSLSCSQSQISFQTELTEAWSCIPNHHLLSGQKKKDGKGKMKHSIKRDGGVLSKCYLAISNAAGKIQMQKPGHGWRRSSLESQSALCWEHSLWQCTSEQMCIVTHTALKHPKIQVASLPLEDLLKWHFC